MKILLVLFGVLAGVLFSVIPGFIFCSVLTLTCFFLMLRKTDTQDKSYVYSVIVLALILRIIALIFFQGYSFLNNSLDIFGDGQDNIVRGFQISSYLKGVSESVPFNLNLNIPEYNMHILTFFNGIFFAFFGYDIFSLKYLNVLALLLSAWFTYYLAKSVSNSGVAKTAMTIVLFWPTLFIWSITDLRESQYVFFSVMMLLSLVMLIRNISKGRRLIYSIFLLIGTTYLFFLRINVMKFFIPAYLIIILIYYFVSWCINKKYLSFRSIMFLVFICGLVGFLNKNMFMGLLKDTYSISIVQHRGYLSSGGYNYNVIGTQDVNCFSLSSLFKLVSASVFHFLFEPLPWRVHSFGLALFFPINLIWYILYYFSFLGVIRIFNNNKFYLFFPFIMFVIIYVLVVSLGVANIGTAVRIRDFIIPVISILASYGFLSKHKEKKIFDQKS